MAAKGGQGTGMSLTEEEKYYMEIFNIFDKDGSGSISKDEFGKAVRAIGFNPTDEDIELLLKKYDEDHTKKLEFDEFARLVKELVVKGKTNGEDAILAAFKVLDKDENGYIEAEELKMVFQKCGQSLSKDEVDEMIAIADSNGDGKINYREFSDYISKPVR